MKRLICRLFGHILDNQIRHPESGRFEQRWNAWLDETIWMEVFLHDCLRCGDRFRVWRLTREAMRKMIENEGV